MAARTYVRAVQELAVLLCKMLSKAGPTWVRLYPDNAALWAAYTAAIAACQALQASLGPLREYGD